MKKKIKLSLVYFRDYFFVSSIITIISFHLLLKNGLSAITITFWAKALISILCLYAHKNRKAKEIFFYLNNGLGEKALLGSMFLIDLLIFVIGTFSIIKYLT